MTLDSLEAKDTKVIGSEFAEDDGDASQEESSEIQFSVNDDAGAKIHH